MSAIVTLPRNERVLRRFGPYPAELNIGEETTGQQRGVRRGMKFFEPATQATLLTFIQRSSDDPVEFFDIGAHIGMHSLIVASIFPADRVRITGFEPTPRTAALCRALAGLNQLPMRLERCAVSDANAAATLYISPWDTSNSLQQGFRDALEEVMVPTVTLDSYCAARGVYPSVIKIDVETYESAVIAGAREALARTRPPIVCEILDVTEAEPKARTLSVMSDLGYHVHRWTAERIWQPCTYDDVMNSVEHEGKDWLFTGEPLDASFHVELHEWFAALDECTTATTRKIDADSAPRRPKMYTPTTPNTAAAAAPVHGAAALVERVRGEIRRLAR